MISTFDDVPHLKASWRAVQIWQILLGRAERQQLITYGQLAQLMGLEGAGVLPNMLGRLMKWCEKEDLPPLTCLVVNQQTGAPGSGLSTVNNHAHVDAERMRVFAYPWYTILPPTPEGMEEASRDAA